MKEIYLLNIQPLNSIEYENLIDLIIISDLPNRLEKMLVPISKLKYKNIDKWINNIIRAEQNGYLEIILNIDELEINLQDLCFYQDKKHPLLIYICIFTKISIL